MEVKNMRGLREQRGHIAETVDSYENKDASRLPVFAERLNILYRKSGNKTVTDFAKQLGLTRQTTTYYLNGERVPDIITLQTICNKCRASADWLIGVSENCESFDEAIQSRGTRFKDARLAYNKHGKQTQAEVYAATGVPASKIKDLEDDDKERGVDYREIAKLAKHYGVTSDFLFGLSPSPHPKDSEQRAATFEAKTIAANAKLAAAFQEYMDSFKLLSGKDT